MGSDNNQSTSPSEASQSTSHSGACHCGAVKFEARGTPSEVGLCHCIDCQKDTGAAFATFVAFKPAQVELSGKASAHFASSTHMRRYFYPTCGSSMYLTDASEDEELMYFNIGVFDDTHAFTPTYEIWTDRKLPWVPGFEGMKGSARG